MLALKRARIQAGDTLIEVLFAVTVFSLVAVGGLAIMNKGITTSQRALEITLVRQEIDAQAETLRFLQHSYVAAYKSGATYPVSTPAGQWASMITSITSTGTVNASSFGTASSCNAPPAGSFVLNSRKATFVPPSAGVLQPAQIYSRVMFDVSDNISALVGQGAQGIWIEGVRSATSGDPNQANAGYTDFHIRACWSSPGQSMPVTLGTIVRLYEPRG